MADGAIVDELTGKQHAAGHYPLADKGLSVDPGGASLIWGTAILAAASIHQTP
jgi:hypothetical protein